MVTADQSQYEDTHKSARIYYCTAIACAVIPLAAGSLVYWIWRYTRWQSLPQLGVMTIMCGLVFFLAGVIFLALFWVNESRSPSASRTKLARKTVLAAALLLVNFPAAAFYAWSAIDHMPETMVRIVNSSDQDLDSFALHGPGVEIDARPIRAGSSSRKFLDFTGNGTLEFVARQQELRFNGQLLPQVTNRFGGSVTVMVKPGGDFEVTHSTPRWAAD